MSKLNSDKTENAVFAQNEQPHTREIQYNGIIKPRVTCRYLCLIKK